MIETALCFLLYCIGTFFILCGSAFLIEAIKDKEG